MQRFVKIVLIGVCATALTAVLGLAGLIAFGTAPAPPVLDSVTAPFAHMDLAHLPPIERYRARDGAQLAYRHYHAGADQLALLIHGSAGSSSDLHSLALALQGAGISVVVPDLRGHGANFPHGDIDYVGQLDDDMADLLEALRAVLPDARRILVGFSSGGGFALRMAANASLGRQFDQVVLLSPYLRFNAPTLRSNLPPQTKSGAGTTADPPSLGNWASAYVGRMIGLTILNRFHVHALDGLAVLAFAVPPRVQTLTAWYSWRLEQNFAPHDDYLADIRAAPQTLQVLVGTDDELFLADQMQKLFREQQPQAKVIVLPGIGHSALVTDRRAIDAIVDACRTKATG